MLHGPNHYYKCPNCDNLLTKGSLISGNTFGATRFSDGKMIAPMLIEFPDLTKCNKCDTIFWLCKIEEIDIQKESEDKKAVLKNAVEVKFLVIDDYLRALDTGIAENKKEELIIRERIWWAYNDRIRSGHKIFNDIYDELRWNDNLNKLLLLLDKTDTNQKLMTAEINRNLGNFEICIKIVQSIKKENFNWLKEIFISECKRKNRWVVQLN